MNLRFRLAATGLALAILAACGAPTPHPRDDADVKAPDSTGGSADETVFDDLIQTKDRARAVEGVLQEGKASTDKAIEESESGGSGDH